MDFKMIYILVLKTYAEMHIKQTYLVLWWDLFKKMT